MRSVVHLPVASHLATAAGRAFAGAALAPFGFDDLAEEVPEIDGAANSEKLLQVGDIARGTGKTVRAIHHYEDVGLLRPHARSKGRYRLYDQGALTRVRWIGKLHDLGLSLAEIQQIVRLWEKAPSAPGAMAAVRTVYQQRLAETRAQIERLSTLENELVQSLAYLDTCESCDPAELVRACASCNHHDERQEEPELVAGIHGGHGPRRSARPLNEAERPAR
jgi:MerR family transcriptional regulator, copper efflux regulator